MGENLVVQAKSSPNRQRWSLIIVAGVLCLGGTTAGIFWHRSQSSPAPQPVTVPIKTVTALGRLEPKGEVIQLSAPASGQTSRIEQLLVKEGDIVKNGQTIAILDNRDKLQAAVEQAQEQVRVAQAKLAQIQAGAKQGEIDAQKATIARLNAQRQGDVEAQTATVERLQAEVQNAASEYQRYENLYQAGAISASVRDNKQLTLKTAQKNLQEAQATLRRTQTTSTPQLGEAEANLERIAEVRPVDVKAARAEINQAIASVKQTKANLEQAFVKSTQNGTVLKINSRAGEVIGNSGIVEIGETSPMYAVAEVYQSDISRVKVGQSVRVISDALPGELQGEVESMGAQVKRQEIINTDPSTNIDARVIEVHVRLDEVSSQKASKFTNLQVKVVIES
ncbi:MAG: ABC exporter membrane fusion protein [Coleofasciculaceae cyanobacterium]